MISALIHTFNEAKNLGRCLSSIQWVDEIVIVDMGSVDKTLDIAKEYGCKTFQYPYTGFVEPARNFGISKTKGEWILVIDADEEIPKTLANFIQLEIKKPSADYYRISRKNIIFGRSVKYSGWWPDYQTRLFRRGQVTWTEKIHGVPLTKGKGADIESEEKLSIIHYNYQSIEQYIERLNRYSSITAKELFFSNCRFKPSMLFEKPVQEFINRYFIWKGYKENIHGLVLAFLQAFSELVTYIKLWELESFKEHDISLKDIDSSINYEYRIKKYWLISELLSTTRNSLERIVLKLKRKFRIYA